MNQKKGQKQLFFVTPNLKPGGAQRVISFLAKQLDNEIFNVKLIVLGSEKANAFDLESVELIFLNKSRLITSIPALIKLFRREKPNVVFSSISHLNIVFGMLAVLFKKIKFVAREASVVSKRSEFSTLSEKMYSVFLKTSYKNFKKIVCQSNDMRNDFIENYNIAPNKLVLINNPITEEISITTRRQFDEKCVRFVTVGRLTEIKGHIRILTCLAEINEFDFVYKIVGSGKLKSEIELKVTELGLQNKVSFLPFTSEVLKELMQNDYYLQGSYVEGFPNALLESCSVGTPIIAFNVPGGTKEILEHEVNGYLVENEEEFVNTIKNLQKLKSISHPEQIANSVLNKFSASKILSEYALMFKEITKS